MKKYDMYQTPPYATPYDNTTSFYEESEYDMYGKHSKCGVDHIHVGPLVIEICQHEEGSHVIVYNDETGEKIAETDVSDHSPEDHFNSVAEGMDDIHKAYMESQSMNKSEKLKAFLDKANSKKLEHYSPNQGMSEIDPSFQGSGVDSRTKGRSSAHPHSFYYVAGSEPEHLVHSQAKSKYTVDIPEEASIYNISHDPEGFASQIREKNNGAFNMDEMHDAIKAAGHHGFTASNHPVDYMRNVVALYHSMPVSHEEDLGKSQGAKKYVTVGQNWASKIYNRDTKNFHNPVTDAGKNKPEHVNDLHALKQAGHIYGWQEHDHPKKKWGEETYELHNDGKLSYVGANHDSSD